MSGDDDPPRSAALPPGFDEEDPYAEADLDDYPAWWRQNVREFRDHGLRPYRPSRFADGSPVTEVLEDLERTHGVTVRLRSVDPHEGADWRIEVDDTAVATVPRFRHADGYSVFDVQSSAVEEAVSAYASEEDR